MFFFVYISFLDKIYKTYIKIVNMISQIKRNILDQIYLKLTMIIIKFVINIFCKNYKD